MSEVHTSSGTQPGERSCPLVGPVRVDRATWRCRHVQFANDANVHGLQIEGAPDGDLLGLFFSSHHLCASAISFATKEDNVTMQ
jgi:hypothetical protein